MRPNIPAIKILAFGILSILSIGLLHGQTKDSVSFLSCSTWGRPDWRIVESDLKRTGATETTVRFTEFDSNIRSVTPRRVYPDFYNEDIYLRWLITDTTVLYDIKLSIEGQVFFESSSNSCGIRIRAGSVTLVNRDIIEITVDRNKEYDKGEFNWGLYFQLIPLSPRRRQQISGETSKLLNSRSTDQPYLSLMNFFLKNKLTWDAIAVLEYTIEQQPGDEAIKAKYWQVINELYLRN